MLCNSCEKREATIHLCDKDFFNVLVEEASTRGKVEFDAGFREGEIAGRQALAEELVEDDRVLEHIMKLTV